MRRNRAKSLSMDWEKMMHKGDSKSKTLRAPPTEVLLYTQDREAVSFVTSSVYVGTWNKLGMSGEGVYRMPHDVIYEGEMRDGMFHGEGTLHYPNNTKINGIWEKGRMICRRFVFADGFTYEEDDPFTYCKRPDRRFCTELKSGLKPAGRSRITNRRPPQNIPPECYDHGCTFYNSRSMSLFDARTGQIIGVPDKITGHWIEKHCRKAWDENVGFLPHFYECWFDNEESISECSVVQTPSRESKPESETGTFLAEVRKVGGGNKYETSERLMHDKITARKSEIEWLLIKKDDKDKELAKPKEFVKISNGEGNDIKHESSSAIKADDGERKIDSLTALGEKEKSLTIEHSSEAWDELVETHHSSTVLPVLETKRMKAHLQQGKMENK